MVGALDMGGGSNQLVMYNHDGVKAKVEADHFWSHSYLHYGVERIRERVLDALLAAYLANESVLPVDKTTTTTGSCSRGDSGDDDGGVDGDGGGDSCDGGGDDGGVDGDGGGDGCDSSGDDGGDDATPHSSTTCKVLQSSSSADPATDDNCSSAEPSPGDENARIKSDFTAHIDFGNSPEADLRLIPNPCAQVNSRMPHNDSTIFVGTGEADECIKVIERVMWPVMGRAAAADGFVLPGQQEQNIGDDSNSEPENMGEGEWAITAEIGIDGTGNVGIDAHGDELVENEASPSSGDTSRDRGLTQRLKRQQQGHQEQQEQQGCFAPPCAVDEVEHPGVSGHHFFAMSVYYFALDCVRKFSPEPLPHW